MEEIGKYKISDLVKVTALPRTTITDWLERYASYLTYTNLGKRRFYSERTLEIIREIVAMRDGGKSSLEIDQALAAKYPVRPEDITNLPPDAPLSEDDSEDEPEGTPVSPSPDEHALIARRQADEVARLISGQLQAIAQRLDSLEQHQSRPRPLPWLLAFLLLFALGIGGYLAFGEIRKLQTENRRMTAAVQSRDAELEKRDAELKNRDRQLADITVNLDRAGKDYQQNLNKLQQTLDRQQQTFQQQLARMAADSTQTREAVLLQIRENFTAERLKLLQQLDNPALSQEQRAAILKQLDDLAKKMEASFRNFEPSKTVPATAAPVPPAATKPATAGKL